jgi:exodeoxyribonuclease-1
MTFVFYDTETTGLRIGFDQIVQFAAIKTDNDLNEIDRFDVRSRLLPHVVPHPKAMLTNGLGIDTLIDEALPTHYQMVVALRRRLLEWSPAIFVGYNSMGFDEEMLRHALFQTVHPAYLTNSNQNCRADAMGLALAAAALAPGVLTIPSKDDGRPSFRLTELAAANGIPTGRSHDAMADAESALGLSRRIKDGAPEVWQRFVRFSKKATVAEFVDVEDGFVLTEYFANDAYHQPVVSLGPDPNLSTRRLCLRLDIDLEAMAAMTDAELQIAFSRKPNPMRTVKVNAAPALTALFDATEAMLGALPFDTYEERARRIKSDESFRSRLVANYLAARREFDPAEVVEQRIHVGLPAGQDEYRMASFHDVSWPDAVRLVQELDHDGLRAFGARVIYCEARSHLPEEMRLLVERELTDRLVVETGYGFTLGQAIASVDEMLAEGPDPDGILAGYRIYLLGREQKVKAYRATLIPG